MSLKYTHANCKYYGRRKCPHINSDIMKRATRGLDNYYGREFTVATFPTEEEIDNICNNECDMFTQI